ncbi:hypothetical protein [Bradyrhizobium yuanmingense]|uniref:hypothetical protein n=1 Tax=Bradyrhizobium yuanmingense TaxID=108015 RepID=UPI0023B98D1D|nr:hypothetical protein [Bradyrhizobium yuanmingense]
MLALAGLAAELDKLGHRNEQGTILPDQRWRPDRREIRPRMMYSEAILARWNPPADLPCKLRLQAKAATKRG